MKYPIIGLLFFSAITVEAQEPRPERSEDSLIFFNHHYKIPAGYSTGPAQTLFFDGNIMTWYYLTNEMLSTLPQETLGQMSKGLKHFKNKKLTCYVQGKEAVAYLAEYDNREGKKFQLVIAGTIDNQPGLIQILFNKEPNSNADLPAFTAAFISLEN